MKRFQNSLPYGVASTIRMGSFDIMERHAVPGTDTAASSSAGVYFEYISRRCSWPIEIRVREVILRRHFFSDVDHDVIRDPDDINREVHVRHPEAVSVGLGEEEEHAGILRECRSSGKSFSDGRVVPRELDREPSRTDFDHGLVCGYGALRRARGRSGSSGDARS